MAFELSLGTLAWASLASTAVSVGASAYSQRQQGKAVKSANEHNADNLRNVAAGERSVALENMRRLRQQNGRELGRIRSQLGASGLMPSEGSNLDLLQESEELLELRILDSARNASLRDQSINNQRRSLLYGGDLAQTTANNMSMGTILSGAGRLVGNGVKYKQEGLI